MQIFSDLQIYDLITAEYKSCLNKMIGHINNAQNITVDDQIEEIEAGRYFLAPFDPQAENSGKPFIEFAIGSLDDNGGQIVDVVQGAAGLGTTMQIMLYVPVRGRNSDERVMRQLMLYKHALLMVAKQVSDVVAGAGSARLAGIVPLEYEYSGENLRGVGIKIITTYMV